MDENFDNNSATNGLIGIKCGRHHIENDNVENNGDTCGTCHFYPDCYHLSHGSNRVLSFAARGYDLDTIGNEGINHRSCGLSVSDHPARHLGIQNGFDNNVHIYIVQF